MTDLEMTKLCAEAMGEVLVNHDDEGLWILCPREQRESWSINGEPCKPYHPLGDDAQAMALMKKFHIQLTKTLRTPADPFGMWIATRTDKFMSEPNHDLNRAIVECVARLQAGGEGK